MLLYTCKLQQGTINSDMGRESTIDYYAAVTIKEVYIKRNIFSKIRSLYP